MGMHFACLGRSVDWFHWFHWFHWWIGDRSTWWAGVMGVMGVMGVGIGGSGVDRVVGGSLRARAVARAGCCLLVLREANASRSLRLVWNA
ncbi:hypothetical protein RF106_05265 [Escherichia coli]|nr:hypothetical protein [Escherichia coli]